MVKEMKKIFISILALAALVGCNTPVVENVVSTLSAPMEVSVSGDTRVFDNDLKWSWQSDDTIAALQLAGDMTVNTLTLKENGKFGTDEFKYATAEAASFMFVYPAEAFDSSTFSYKFVQSGVWTPTLTGFVTDATIGSFTTVEMVHQSAAFEIRVWEAGRQARKSIKSAAITSTADFLNGYGNAAAVSDINSDTVVFNLAAGDYAFELTLTAADDSVYTVAVPTKNFAAGKRTILNVEWKSVEPTLSYTILSSYTNKDNSLDGRSIYVKDIVLTDADSATIALYLNGNKVADMTPGKTTTVSNLNPGQYSAVVKWSANGKEYTSESTKVCVSGIPYSYSFYDSSTDAVDAAGWTRNGNTGYQSSLLWLSNNLGGGSGWVASPAVYGEAAYSAKVTVVTKFYCIAMSAKTMTVYVGATSSPTSSSSSAVSHSSKSSTATSSTKDLRTGTATLSFSAGTQYVSINHNNVTGTASYFYLSSYKIEY